MKNPLVETKRQKVVTDSLRVAENFGKKHKHVIEKIEKVIREDKKDRLIFRPILYKDSYGREQRKFDMDRKSFSILCMSFTGKKALKWKLKFYDAFEKMEKALLQIHTQRQSDEWVAQRQAGKLTRREETDTIQEFVDYAHNQGSKNAHMYYCNITKMENKALFLLEQKFKNIRNILNLNQLATVDSADSIVSKALKEGMQSNLHYKDIYQLAKKRIETFAEIRGKTFIPTTQLQINA